MMIEVLFMIDGRYYLLRELPNRLHVLAPGPQVREALPFRERKKGPIYKRPGEENLVIPYGTRQPIRSSHSEWYLPLDQFGSLASATFYPTIWWEGMRVFVRRWASECAVPHVLKADVCIDNALSHSVIAGMIKRGELSPYDHESQHAAATRLRTAQLKMLTEHGLRLIPDNYGPSSAWGDMRLSELELTEGPCPFQLVT